MEKAGRSLTLQTLEMISLQPLLAAILVGLGGNGGCGLIWPRHLHNHGLEVAFVLAQPVEEMHSVDVDVLRTLRTAGIKPVPEQDVPRAISQAGVLIDALIGDGLSGAPRRQVADLIQHAYASS